MPIVTPEKKATNTSDQHYLLKFLLAAGAFLFVGTVQGVLQVLPPIRSWLDSIGSPIAGPGHMIDPLAHAHVNIVGGLVMISMAMSYYLLEKISEKPLYSRRLANHSFWWLTFGVIGFYSTLIIFGYMEGELMLADMMDEAIALHSIYGITIAIVSTVMGMGFWIFFANIFVTIRRIYKSS